MLKNTANQYITFGLVDASDGSELTGASPSIYITKDDGSQAAGAGLVTEKGNGQYHYAFTQAETNADMVGFLAIATGAVMVSFTIYPVDVSLFKADVAAALATYDPPTKAELDAAIAALNDLDSADIQAAITTVINAAQTESYAADGSTASIVQLLYMIFAILAEPNYSGTTLTANKLDGSTPAMTFALDDEESPTTQTRNG